MLKKSLFVLAALLLTVSFTHAQRLPSVDVSAGYTHAFGPSNCDCANNGANASIAFSLNNWFGVVGEIDYLHQNAINTPSMQFPSLSRETYLFGPRISYRKINRLQPFVQLLAGPTHLSTKNNVWSYELGGGIDIGLDKNSRFALRPQAMYTNSSGNVTSFGSGGNVYFLDLVYRFGHKPVGR